MNQHTEVGNPDPPTISLVNLEPEQLSEEQLCIIGSFVEIYDDLNHLSVEKDQFGSNKVSWELLQRIESAIRRRDELEDRYGVIGILVEPIYHTGLARELRITIGSLRAGTFRPQTWVSSWGQLKL